MIEWLKKPKYTRWYGMINFNNLLKRKTIYFLYCKQARNNVSKMEISTIHKSQR